MADSIGKVKIPTSKKALLNLETDTLINKSVANDTSVSNESRLAASSKALSGTVAATIATNRGVRAAGKPTTSGKVQVPAGGKDGKPQASIQGAASALKGRQAVLDAALGEGKKKK